MLQSLKPDPARASRARAIAIHIADVLQDSGVDVTLPRFLELIQFVAGMLPPAATDLSAAGALASAARATAAVAPTGSQLERNHA